jgi:hypothetical protein
LRSNAFPRFHENQLSTKVAKPGVVGGGFLKWFLLIPLLHLIVPNRLESIYLHFSCQPRCCSMLFRFLLDARRFRGKMMPLEQHGTTSTTSEKEHQT